MKEYKQKKTKTNPKGAGRPPAGSRPSSPGPAFFLTSPQEHRTVKNIDLLAEFEDFKDSLLPALAKDLKAGLTAQEIYKKYQAIAAARGIQIAMTEVDSSKALSAVKDILDREQGRPTEKKEIKHVMENLPDEQLDALILSKMKTTGDEEEGEPKH